MTTLVAPSENPPRSPRVLTRPSSSQAQVAAEARAVVKVYGTGDTAVRALDGSDLVVPAGQFTAVMGPSGSGKSTLMHAMAGLDTIDSGRVLIGGTDLTTLGEHDRTLLRRRRIGFIFQSFNLVQSLTAAENIVLPLTLAGERADRQWLDELAGTLGIADRLTHRPSELSGGQQQRVAAARALITRPEIIFADEPTGNLDSRHGETLLRFLAQATGELGQTIVMVTHDPSAAAHSDRVVFLADGRVVDELAAPTAPAVLSRMAQFETPGTPQSQFTAATSQRQTNAAAPQRQTNAAAPQRRK